MIVTKHAAEMGVARLGFEPPKARHKIEWLRSFCTETPASGLPPWFRRSSQSSRTTRFRCGNYLGAEVVLVEEEKPDGVVVVTIVTEALRHATHPHADFASKEAPNPGFPG